TDSFSGQWDNHGKLQPAFDQMLPVYDRMLAALLDDLADRGLLGRVVGLGWGGVGRGPKIKKDAGRGHWGAPALVPRGGGGLRGGVGVGSSSGGGEEPRDRPVEPNDVLATVYHALGIDAAVEVPDQGGRPVRLLTSGEPIRELV